MRLGRPLAAASVMTAALGASLAASPALADGNFKIADEQPNIVSASSTAFTVSGTGCSGTDAAVGIALYSPDGTMSTVVRAEPAADSSWSATLNLPELIKSTGVEAKSDGSADGWYIGAACVAYGEQKGHDEKAIAFDDTNVNGTFEIYTDENGVQTFTVDATGFSANEEVTVTLVGKDDPSITYSIGKIAADAEGKVHDTLQAPSGVADGQYLLTLEGSRYGETATSQKVITVQNGAFDLADLDTDGNGLAGDGNATADPAAPSTSTGTSNGVTIPASNGATQAASNTSNTSNKPLARTGANGLLFGGIAVALVVIGGGALVVRRRKA